MTEGHDGWEPDDSWEPAGADPVGPAEHGLTDDGLGDDAGLPPYDDGHPGGEPDQPDHPAEVPGDDDAGQHGLHYAVDEAGQPPAGSEPDDVPLAEPPAEPAAETTVDTSELAGPAQPVDATPFPPPLELDVSPSDGQPWVDPDLLGTESADPTGGADLEPSGPPTDPPAALLVDLHAADGGDGPPTASALAASDDPAVRALTALWTR